jgi:hypothetical protein
MMTKFSPDQAKEIAGLSVVTLRATADRIEAIAQSSTNPDDALWEIHRAILSEPMGALLEFAQDTLYPALSDAAE